MKRKEIIFGIVNWIPEKTEDYWIKLEDQRITYDYVIKLLLVCVILYGFTVLGVALLGVA